jgi:hypothetical protein
MNVMNILFMSIGYLSQNGESYLKHKHEDSDGHPTEASALFASKRGLGQNAHRENSHDHRCLCNTERMIRHRMPMLPGIYPI